MVVINILSMATLLFATGQPAGKIFRYGHLAIERASEGENHFSA